jgi:D-xylulose reductase
MALWLGTTEFLAMSRINFRLTSRWRMAPWYALVLLTVLPRVKLIVEIA